MILGVCITVISSCTVVKQYPKDSPFIFENSVNINGDIQKDKKQDLKSELLTQVEDSAEVVENTELPWPKKPWIIPSNVIKKPPRFDSVAVIQSIINMTNLMISKGYRQASVGYDSSMKVSKDQQRIKVVYNVNAGKLNTIDSIAYVFPDSNLQRIIRENMGKSLLKKEIRLTMTSLMRNSTG